MFFQIHFLSFLKSRCTSYSVHQQIQDPVPTTPGTAAGTSAMGTGPGTWGGATLALRADRPRGGSRWWTGDSCVGSEAVGGVEGSRSISTVIDLSRQDRRSCWHLTWEISWRQFKETPSPFFPLLPYAPGVFSWSQKSASFGTLGCTQLRG